MKPLTGHRILAGKLRVYKLSWGGIQISATLATRKGQFLPYILYLCPLDVTLVADQEFIVILLKSTGLLSFSYKVFVIVVSLSHSRFRRDLSPFNRSTVPGAPQNLKLSNEHISKFGLDGLTLLTWQSFRPSETVL